MRFYSRYKIEITAVLIIVSLYFLLRLPHLTVQPIFADEAIYIRWAQVMRSEPTLRFLPLSDGKTPLFMWTMMPLFKIFSDPLFAGRFLSVISGVGTLAGVFFLGYKFFNLRVGIWAAFLVAITPFMVFFDRMALVDSMLAAFSIWSLNSALLLVKFPRIDLAMTLGYFLGGGLLTKTPGMFNLVSLPATLFIFDWSKKARENRLLKLLGLWIIAVVITMVIYNILRLGPGFGNLNSRNQDYVFSFDKLIETPIDPFLPHLRDLSEWVNLFIGLPIAFFILAGFVMAVTRRNRIALAIFFWGAISVFIQMNLLKTFTARYILFSIPPLLTLAAWAIDSIVLTLDKFYFKAIVFLLLLSWPLYFSLELHTTLEKTPLPKNERAGYLEEWTAGYGLKDIANFLIEQKRYGSVVVGTEGSFGTLPDGLQIYLDKAEITVLGGKATISAQLRQAATDNQTYFVSNSSRFGEAEKSMTLLRIYPKTKNEKGQQDAILLFQIFPQAK